MNFMEACHKRRIRGRPRIGSWKAQTMLSRQKLPFPLQRAARREFFARPTGWLIVTALLWCVCLILFHVGHSLDLAVAQSFFQQEACRQGDAGALTGGRICGYFPYGREMLLIGIRKLFFFLPATLGLVILYLLLKNLSHHGATYCDRKTRDYSIALTSLLLGPYLLVNLIIKQVSSRPRPYDTDLFGGHNLFMAAGDFGGACMKNCSFVSGEAAGMGWVACLVVLLPKRLRPLLAPPIILLSLLASGLRVAFGGHYLSDVMLGWLASVAVYAAVAAYFEMSHRARKQSFSTLL